MDPEAPVKVYEAWNSHQAHLVRQLLEEAGIFARVASDAVEMVVGEIPFQKASCPVWVKGKDAERARVVVADYELRLQQHHNQIEPEAEDTFCYHCGCVIEPRQSPCPQCGRLLDWTVDS